MEVFVIFLISMYILNKSSNLVIKYSINLSHALGISTFAVGFILIAIATSLPELFVSIIASLKNDISLAVGNILGSNLVNLTVVIGIPTIFGGTIYLKKRELLELVELLFVSLLIMIFVFFRGSLEAVHGGVLLILFMLLLGKLYRKGHITILEEKKQEKLGPNLVRFILSVAALLIASNYLVNSSLEIAELFGISSAVIGATIVAMGTSLPELSVSLAAVKEKQYSLALGNIFGSTITNITLVLGSIALLTPSVIDITPLFDLLPFLLISTVTVWYLLSRKNKITKDDGFILIMIYLLFLIEKAGIYVFNII
jgi:cation:H+ antiporter